MSSLNRFTLLAVLAGAGLLGCASRQPAGPPARAAVARTSSDDRLPPLMAGGNEANMPGRTERAAVVPDNVATAVDSPLGQLDYGPYDSFYPAGDYRYGWIYDPFPQGGRPEQHDAIIHPRQVDRAVIERPQR